jgi:hypothetical protein
MTTPIERLVERLIAEGYLDKQADARLAAIRLILAAGPQSEKPEPTEDDGLD